jgi:hypothetical protein
MWELFPFLFLQYMLYLYITEEPKEMGEFGMTVEMEEKMSNMVKNPSQKWSSNKILTERMIKLVEEIKRLNSPPLSTTKQQ